MLSSAAGAAGSAWAGGLSAAAVGGVLWGPGLRRAGGAEVGAQPAGLGRRGRGGARRQSSRARAWAQVGWQGRGALGLRFQDVHCRALAQGWCCCSRQTTGRFLGACVGCPRRPRPQWGSAAKQRRARRRSESPLLAAGPVPWTPDGRVRGAWACGALEPKWHALSQNGYGLIVQDMLDFRTVYSTVAVYSIWIQVRNINAPFLFIDCSLAKLYEEL